jgi:hypothetical protein
MSNNKMSCYRCNMKRVRNNSDIGNVIHNHFLNYDEYYICKPCSLIIFRLCSEYCKGNNITAEQLNHNGLTKFNKTYNSSTFYSNKDKDIIKLFHKCNKCK